MRYAAEFGIITSKGLCKIEPLLARIASVPEEKVPTLAKDMFAVFAGEFEQVQAELGKVERLLKEWYKSNERVDGWSKSMALVQSALRLR